MKLVGTVLSGIAVSVFALSMAAPAQAAEEERRDFYRLSIEKKHSGKKEHKFLFCDPPGGNHPHAEEACDLIYAFGSIKKIDLGDSACPMIWDPVVARSEGSEHFKKTFPNKCVLLDVKGEVFDFSNGKKDRGTAGMVEGGGMIEGPGMTTERGMGEAGHPSFHGGLHGHHGLHGHQDDFADSKKPKKPKKPKHHDDDGYYYDNGHNGHNGHGHNGHNGHNGHGDHDDDYKDPKKPRDHKDLNGFW
ncbi:SSI family serine proteinase inhibitor [Nocardiopsis sp. NPDC050513]|uniref:SSI family serine proteinase inhibitor n=1 Tax=Nocardiopsis sp. NPDC050513 TaxID=3364338 RepID=UPI003798D901